MNKTKRLQERLKPIIHADTDALSLIVRIRGEDIVSHRPEALYPAASISKLGPVALAIHRLREGLLLMERKLTLKNHHIKQEAGVLKHLPPGFQLETRDILNLILSESDTTALNVLLGSARLGTQAQINTWLRSTIGVETTGLTDRYEDTLFESDLMRPIDMMAIFEWVIREEFVREALRRSQTPQGLRSFAETSEDRSRRLYQLLARVPLLTQYRRQVVRRTMMSPPSKVTASKVGVLPCELTGDHGYYHEAAQFLGGRKKPLVIICSRDTDPALFPRIGKILHEWCC